MACTTCSKRSVWRELSRAAAKSAGDRMRRLGLLTESDLWPQRAIVCERCSLRVLRNGVTYCGEPFLSQMNREPAEGCGCPIKAKAKDPNEHCPLSTRHAQAEKCPDGTCNCKWCTDADAAKRYPLKVA